MTEYQKYITSVYGTAVAAGLVSTRKEFAEAVGVHSSSLSAAMNGSREFTGKGIISRVRSWAAQNGLGIEDAPKIKTIVPDDPLMIEVAFGLLGIPLYPEQVARVYFLLKFVSENGFSNITTTDAVKIIRDAKEYMSNKK